jgi:acyl carrier protein
MSAPTTYLGVKRRATFRMDTVIYKVRRFLSSHFSQAELRDDTNFFEQGFISSLFAIQLVTFVENEFHISVDTEDLNIENFNTISHIVKFIHRKLG